MIERDDETPVHGGGGGGADDSGLVVLVSFDNSHSVLREKTLSYYVSCLSMAGENSCVFDCPSAVIPLPFHCLSLSLHGWRDRPRNT